MRCYPALAIVVVAATVLALSGCVSEPIPEYDPDELVWFSDAPELEWTLESPDLALVAEGDGPTEGEALPESFPLYELDESTDTPDEPLEEVSIDVCTLLDLSSFREEAGDPEAQTFLFDDGYTCLFAGPVDHRRVSISFVPISGEFDRTFIGLDQTAQEVEDTEYLSLWITGYPFPFANTLIIELPHGDLVYMTFSREPSFTEEEQREAAEATIPALIEGVTW